jgi:hypothetical protein
LACQKKCVIRFWFWKHSVGVFHFGYLCMKQGSLFCFVMLRWDPPKPWGFMLCSCIFKELLMSRGALTWFETVWSYSVEKTIDYWIIFSMKTK